MNMTESEAKKEIEHNVFCNTDDFEMKISKECYKTMINALQKQVEIKPKDITPHYMDSKVYECPICKEVYTYRDAINNYCKYLKSMIHNYFYPLEIISKNLIY